MSRPSDHYDGERFFNPTVNARPLSAVPKMMAERREPWPAHVPVDLQKPRPHDPAAWATVTFVGHSTFIVQTAAATIITDPVFSERASPLSFVGPRRVRRPAVPLQDVPSVDIVLLSHNHYDHCDLASLRHLARRCDPTLVTPLGNRRLARAAGFRRIVELDWWETTNDAALPITVTPAQHFSARTPFDRNRALWGGFVVGIEDRHLFFAGDSGYGPHFSEIGSRFENIGLSLLPIGAYEPRWFMRDIHMNPDEAVRAHLALGSARSLGMHFGTFQLTTEGIDAPVRALAHARTVHGVADALFSTLDFGESAHIGQS
ncbi:MAG: MBL fold metallo-hydrolase [Vicinamibacterales bacterium]